MLHAVSDGKIAGVVYVKSEPEKYNRLGVQYRASERRFACTDVISSAAFVMRGLYYRDQAQATLLRCINGRASIAAVDLRQRSRTFGAWTLKCIDPNREAGALFIPAGCAYGSLTLQDNTLLLRQTTEPDDATPTRVLAWDSVGINWGLVPGQGIRLDNFGLPDAVRYDEIMAQLRDKAA